MRSTKSLLDDDNDALQPEWTAADVLARLWPLLWLGGAVFLATAPTGLTLAAPFGPLWLALVIGVWAQRAPDALPAWLVFVAAILAEGLRAGPVGLETFALLLMREGLVAGSRARAPRGLLEEWARFALAICAVELFIFTVMTLTFAAPADLLGFARDLAERGAVTIAAFPLAAMIFGRFGAPMRRQAVGAPQTLTLKDLRGAARARVKVKGKVS